MWRPRVIDVCRGGGLENKCRDSSRGIVVILRGLGGDPEFPGRQDGRLSRCGLEWTVGQYVEQWPKKWCNNRGLREVVLFSSGCE